MHHKGCNLEQCSLYNMYRAMKPANKEKKMDILKSPKSYANSLIFYGWTVVDIVNPQASSAKPNILAELHHTLDFSAEYKAEVVTHMKKFFGETV